MGKSQQRELENRLEVLLQHLLQWKFQPERRSRRLTANSQRRDIERLLLLMPSLRGNLPPTIAEAYGYAVRATADETDLAREVFPPACPFPIEQVLDETFFPD